MKKRLFSMFLCLCMVFTLVETMLPVAGAFSPGDALTTVGETASAVAKAKAIEFENERITAKITEYTQAVAASGKYYWNGTRATYHTDKLIELLTTEPYPDKYTDCLTSQPCEGLGGHFYTDNPYGNRGCKSNKFVGISGNDGWSQCGGFADYIVYVIFGTNNGDLWTTVRGSDAVSDYVFRPGDLIRYKTENGNWHSVVIYEASADTVRFIECNNKINQKCGITWDRTMPISKFKTLISSSGGYIKCPTDSLRSNDSPTPAPSTPAIAKPDAPKNITGKWTSTGPKWQAEISWDTVSGATYYNVQYRTPTENQWKKDNDYSSSNKYISTGLGKHPYYEYRVQAGNAGGVSSWKYYTLEKPTAVKAPDKPESVSANWTFMMKPRLSWAAVNGAEYYEVQHKKTTGGSWSSAVTVKSNTAHTFSDLGLESSYNFRVKAVNTGGSSGWTECSLLSPKDIVADLIEKEPTIVAPAAPAGVSAKWKSTGSGASAELSWNAVNNVDYYEVGYKKADGAWEDIPLCISSTSYTFDNLDSSFGYSFHVKAVKSNVSSGWAECSLTKAATVQPISAPTGVSGTWTSTGPQWQARISWNAVSGATHYEVQYRTPKTGNTWKADIDYKTKTDTSYVSTGLGDYNSYDYRVRACNATGASDWTSYTLTKEPLIIDRLSPSAPTGLSGTWTSTGPQWQARISWNSVSGADYYEVQYRTPKTGNTWKADADYSSGTSYISTGLGDYNSYDYRVRACNSAGASDWTTYTLVKTVKPELTPPDVPKGISGSWTSTGPKWQARISWNSVSGADYYEVQYRTPKTGNTWKADADYSSGTSYISTGLGDYNSYDYRVRACNSAGASAWATYTLIKTTGTTTPTPAPTTPTPAPTTPAAPSAPTGVSGSWTSTGPQWQARISWNSVSGADYYEVQYRTPKTGNAWKNDPDYSSGTSYISTGLGDYNSYDYRVRACNSAGASAWTTYTLVKAAPVAVTPATPAAPTNVSGSWTSMGPTWQARISWAAVSGATYYEVQYRTPKTGNAWRADPDYSSGTSYISTGLKDYNSYDYRVRAGNANGVSSWTEYTLYK